MQISKFIQTLIIVNGIIIPSFLGFVLFQIIKESSTPEKIEQKGAYVGEKLTEAKSEGLALQRITFEWPQRIYNSTNYYLPVSAATLKEAKVMKQAISSAGDISWRLLQVFNVVFLDSNYNVIRNLVDKKASIIDIKMPWGRYHEKIDTTIKNIAYLIGFEDTNKDGELNLNDKHDLYISDLEGKNLVKATHQIDLLEYRFKEQHSKIFIKYKERNDKKEEHKNIKFGVYNISTSNFQPLVNLNSTLTEIEEVLIN